MTKGATEGLAVDREAVLDLFDRLQPYDWQRPSGCPGWSVKDLFAHMSALYWLVADPSRLPDVAGVDTEEAQELYVRARRDWTPAQVMDDYRAGSRQAMEVLATLEGQEFEMPLGDLGTYQAHLAANAYAFDHFTHIRADLFAPRGPLAPPDFVPPPVDEVTLGPALDWIEVALPQQNGAAVASLAGPVDLVVGGPGGRTWRINGAAGAAVATVTSDGLAFVRWITQRGSWDELGVSASGDPVVLDVVRTFKVF